MKLLSLPYMESYPQETSKSDAFLLLSGKSRIAFEAWLDLDITKKGKPHMLYNIRIFDADGTLLDYSPSVTDSQAQALYYMALVDHPNARIVYVPIYMSEVRGDHGD